MATAAAEMMLRYVFDGVISVHDLEIERRPYHRNCGCALHKLKGASSSVCSQKNQVSFQKKQSYTDYSLSIVASTFSPQFSLQGVFSVRNREDANEGLSHRDINMREATHN